MTTERPFPGTIEASGPQSIAANIIGTAVTGDVVLPAEVLNAARDIQAPPGSGNLPPLGLCLGRKNDLVWLRDTLTDGNETAITQTPAVHGLGGIGKSTLALAYAHHHRSDYSLIWWVTADSPARIQQSLAGLTLRLFPAWAGRATDDERFQWALSWLQWHPGWLLIFDNVENPSDLAPYTGSLNRGRSLATSRRATGWPRTTPTRSLSTLSPDEAAELLCAWALDGAVTTVQHRQEARALAADLGHLPLALEQAGAYLHQNPTVSIDAYRRRLATKLDKVADGIDAERTIARIWTYTLQAISSSNSLAVRVLHTLAWLAPDNIPVNLVQGLANDPDEIAEAFGILRAYSMISFSPDRTSVSVHRLVQAVLRRGEASSLGSQTAGRCDAEEAVLRALPFPPRPDAELPPEWTALTPHLVALAASSPPGPQAESIITAYTIAAYQLNARGHRASSIPLRVAVLSHHEKFDGETHLDTTIARCHLADAYESAGNAAQAISLYKEALKYCEETLGYQHRATLITRGNLAGAYESAGDVRRSLAMYKKVYKQSVQILGEADPETLTVRNNLAYAYRMSGNLKRAIRLYEINLFHREQSLGNGHASTLNGHNNLATAYQAAGHVEQAVLMLEEVLTQSEKSLGETHPQTMTVRNNLGIAYANMKDVVRATPILETALAQRERILGDVHPDTLQSRNNLAITYLMSGDLEHALPMMETVLVQREQVNGESHPDTLITRHNLATGYSAAGQPERAVTLLEKALAQARKFLGHDHPDTRAYHYSLTVIRHELAAGRHHEK
ncbi:FxSxx-COOH system tetratricopeptide repeat protein [Streptomyces sp. NPDC002667]|uniref:FxSxx-COOH system tetratricopeptide repeat protein n=1 Tax=Streptomyces sp. NPDC002667 TaxID=3364657 RepID=UPI0036B0D76C